jgi:hypothetical protein
MQKNSDSKTSRTEVTWESNMYMRSVVQKMIKPTPCLIKHYMLKAFVEVEA